MVEPAAAERDIRLPYGTSWRDCTPLWTDRRCAALLARMGLRWSPKDGPSVAAPPTTP